MDDSWERGFPGAAVTADAVLGEGLSCGPLTGKKSEPDTAPSLSSQTSTLSGISSAASGAGTITPAPTTGFPNMTSFESGI